MIQITLNGWKEIRQIGTGSPNFCVKLYTTSETPVGYVIIKVGEEESKVCIPELRRALDAISLMNPNSYPTKT